MIIDVERLRRDLIDDGFAAFYGGGFGAALVEAFDLENASAQEVVDTAVRNGLDLTDYII